MWLCSHACVYVHIRVHVVPKVCMLHCTDEIETVLSAAAYFLVPHDD